MLFFLKGNIIFFWKMLTSDFEVLFKQPKVVTFA